MSLDIPLKCSGCTRRWRARFEDTDIVTLTTCPDCAAGKLVILRKGSTDNKINILSLSSIGGSGGPPYQSKAINLDENEGSQQPAAPVPNIPLPSAHEGGQSQPPKANRPWWKFWG